MLVLLAVAAFLALALFGVPFPIVILASGGVGWAVHRWRPALLEIPDRPEPEGDNAPLVPDDALHEARPSRRRNLAILAFGLVIWVAPVAVIALLTRGEQSVFVDQGVFFGGMALVTFGGAYAVLAYVAQAAVQTYGWLQAGEMVRGLALAETTPGPLIMVVQFVAFLGAYRDPGSLDPWVAGVLGSLLVVWVTFVPCFVFIFLGAPYVERLRGSRPLAAALTGVTAAVVGVIANLAFFFAVHTLFTETRVVDWGPVDLLVPVWSSYVWESFLIAAIAMVLAFRFRWSVLKVLGACAVLGLALTAVT
jgi:chromate transporter